MSPIFDLSDDLFDNPTVWETPPTREACKLSDHKFEIEFEAGMHTLICKDPHTDEERAEMIGKRPSGAYHLPACMPGDFHGAQDCLSGTLPVRLEVRVEGGGYEYPDEVDYYVDVYYDDNEALNALRELVRLKDGPRDEAYEEAKPAAWKRAREVVYGT